MNKLLRKILGRGESTEGKAAAAEGRADSPAHGSLGDGWLLQIAGTTILSAAIVLVVLRTMGSASPPIVTFDLIKYQNAERAVAMRFLQKQDADDAGSLLQSIAKRTKDAIRAAAGPGTLVVVRQAVVQGQMRDITDQVLKSLDLPTNVPSVTPSKYAVDVAPTLLGKGPAYQLPSAPPAPPASSLP